MKVFIIHQYIRIRHSWEWLGYRSEYSYKKTINKAFKTRKDAHKYLEGTIGAVHREKIWCKETPYSFYMYEIQQVTID